MKVAIDLQARQTPGSGGRGIGRYSLELAKALVRNRGKHHIHILLNEAYSWDEGAAQREIGVATSAVTFDTYKLLSPRITDREHLRRVRYINDEILNWRYACSGADALHISSMFEGWLVDDAHVSTRLADVPVRVRTATLYDVIPHLFADLYLPGDAREHYYRRLSLFHQLDLIFAISESTRRDAIRTLGVLPERIVNIGASTSDNFRRLAEIPSETMQSLRERYTLPKRFILYTGGVDARKNNDLLFTAYAALPHAMQDQFRLVIVCALSSDERRQINQHVETFGIAQHVTFTGHVSDEHLNLLYNTCELFVFPSLYEGFGLPVLEAMKCGACVIASNCSSIPEIVGRSDVLFDPKDASALQRIMRDLLARPERRHALGEWNIRRAQTFSWDHSAQQMLSALEEVSHSRVCLVTHQPHRPKIALVSPLPPERSGIADYCASMLPYWSHHFDVQLVANVPKTDALKATGRPALSHVEFRRGSGDFDAVLYHFGNSQFHAHTYELLPVRPGVVVMHDFFLSGLMYWLDVVGGHEGLFPRALTTGHGLGAVRDLIAAERGELDMRDIAWKYPVSLKVMQHARGLIFHSRFAQDLLAASYPEFSSIPNCVIPQAAFAVAETAGDRELARSRLAIAADELLVCVFGFVVETKENDLLLTSLCASELAQNPRLRVCFVGELTDAPLKTRLDDVLTSHPMRDRIRFAGYVDESAYREYLLACDVAVSLRAKSRGETSAALLKQLALGRATIVTDYAAMSELPDAVVWKVPPGDASAVTKGLEMLIKHPERRAKIADAARQWAAMTCHPVQVAEQYATAIPELLARDKAQCAAGLIRRIAPTIAQERDLLMRAGEALASGLARNRAAARWLVDEVGNMR